MRRHDDGNDNEDTRIKKELYSIRARAERPNWDTNKVSPSAAPLLRPM